MKLIYVAGPYRSETTDGVRRNIRAAEDRAADVVAAGHYPIVPHLCTGFMDGSAPDDQFMAGSLEAMKRCDEVWLVEGWETSLGTNLEIATALSLGMKVRNERGTPVRQLTIHAARRRAQ